MNNRTKRMLPVLAVLILVFALALCGCGNRMSNQSTQPQETTEDVAQPEYTLDPDKSYAIAGVAESPWDDEVTATTPEESVSKETKPKETVKSTEATTEAPTEAPTEVPTEAPTETPTESPETTTPNTSTGSNNSTAYGAYLEMSADQQVAFMNSFSSVDAFVAWLQNAKQEYENAEDDSIIIDGNGPVDLEGVFG